MNHEELLGTCYQAELLLEPIQLNLRNPSTKTHRQVY